MDIEVTNHLSWETNLTTRNNQRALKVIRSLHSRRRELTKKIDILCNDMVTAHSDFSVKLSKLNFVTAFYESLLNCSTLDDVLDVSVSGIRASIEQADAAIILLADNGFDVHVTEQNLSDSIEKTQFRSWFTRELVSSISQMNRICSLEQLLQMGLQGPPAIMKTISIAAIPLGRLGQGLGLVLVYRPADMPLRSEELSRIAAVSGGLRKAILSHTSDTTSSLSNELSA